MSYRIKVTFGEGVTLDELYEMIAGMGIGPDNPAPGNISHESHMENGRAVFIEEWESKAVFESFVSQMANPALEQAGIPIPVVEER